MEAYLQPMHDGLLTRPSGRWVAEKLDYLKRYIDVFETSMRRKWNRRNYIDLFAGPGKCRVKDGEAVYLGSPLLALTTPHPFTGYHFVDLKTKYIDALRQRCQYHPNFGSVKLYCGDANQVVCDIVAGIRAVDVTHGPSLNLVFLDPQGLQLRWKTVALLATVKKMDMIIYYPQMGLTRNMSTAVQQDSETIFDQFFGGMEWRRIYARFRQGEIRFLHRELINYYRDRLQGLGYTEVRLAHEVGYEPLIRSTTRQAPLYRLLFASKHPLGHRFWREVTKRDMYGQGRLPL